MTTRLDKITSNIKENPKTYSDFYNNLNSHPETGNIVVGVNEIAVKRSIKNLLLTNKGERLFNPNIGTNINKILFDNISEVGADTLKIYIEDTINQFEKRCDLQLVQVVPFFDQQMYSISILFSVINSSKQTTLNLHLYRNR